jgi:hypothetical protein
MKTINVQLEGDLDGKQIIHFKDFMNSAKTEIDKIDIIKKDVKNDEMGLGGLTGGAIISFKEIGEGIATILDKILNYSSLFKKKIVIDYNGTKIEFEGTNTEKSFKAIGELLEIIKKNEK